MLKGNLDLVNLRQAAGWAQDDAQPDVPVSLLVIDNDKLLGRILANRYRAGSRKCRHRQRPARFRSFNSPTA